MRYAIYYNGKLLGVYRAFSADYALTDASRDFRLSYWSLDAECLD